jgi:hypothetical protein
MVEADFQQQEMLRKQAESRKQRLQLGIPPAETINAQILDEQHNIEVHIDNSAVRDFLKTTHEEFQQILSHQQRIHEEKQKESLKLFESELQIVADRLKELIDNFNLYVAEERKDRAAHRARVQQTCDAIDRELSY